MPNHKWPFTEPAKPTIKSSLVIEGTGSKVLARDLRAFVNNPRIPDTAEITLEVHAAMDQRDTSSWTARADWDETDEPYDDDGNPGQPYRQCKAVAPRDAGIRWGMMAGERCTLEEGHSPLRNRAGHDWPIDPLAPGRVHERRRPEKINTGNSLASQREETGG